MSYLQKPEKIYRQNPNLVWLLSESKPDIGNLRETLFYSQTEVCHRVTSSRFGDFTIDYVYTFEIGGLPKRKNRSREYPIHTLLLTGSRVDQEIKYHYGFWVFCIEFVAETGLPIWFYELETPIQLFTQR